MFIQTSICRSRQPAGRRISLIEKAFFFPLFPSSLLPCLPFFTSSVCDTVSEKKKKGKKGEKGKKGKGGEDRDLTGRRKGWEEKREENVERKADV